MKRIRLLGLILICSITLGFRTFETHHGWKINKDDPKLFVKFCERPDDFEQDLPDEDRASNAEDFDELVEYIFDEYNNIEDSYLEVADTETDPDYDEDRHDTRTIDVCFGSPDSAGSGGQAQLVYGDTGYWAGCKITLIPEAKESAKYLKKVILHELGHCFGLGHSQDTHKAIMSYFVADRDTKLQLDDKMGIIYLYGKDRSKRKETNTFGLSCAPRD